MSPPPERTIASPANCQRLLLFAFVGITTQWPGDTFKLVSFDSCTRVLAPPMRIGDL